MSETCEECSTNGACPFACTEISDYAQNMGCLPTPYNIVTMRVEHGLTWACHSNRTKPCLGGINFLKEKGLPYKVINPILQTEYTDWHLYIRGGKYGEVNPPGTHHPVN